MRCIGLFVNALFGRLQTLHPRPQLFGENIVFFGLLRDGLFRLWRLSG